MTGDRITVELTLDAARNIANGYTPTRQAKDACRAALAAHARQPQPSTAAENPTQPSQPRRNKNDNE